MGFTCLLFASHKGSPSLRLLLLSVIGPEDRNLFYTCQHLSLHGSAKCRYRARPVFRHRLREAASAVLTASLSMELPSIVNDQILARQPCCHSY